LDESADKSDESADRNELNTSLTTFPDLHYILNQKPCSQKQFEKFDPFFTTEGFLNFKILIEIRKNHEAFSRHSRNIFNEQALPETTCLPNPNNINRLISGLTSSLNTQENCINRRKERWEGRKRLATIPIAVGIDGKYFLLFGVAKFK